MNDDMFEAPSVPSSIIKVIGVGGGGSNAVNYMYNQGIRDVNFVVCNTDKQALQKSPVPIQVALGHTLTEGRGAGNRPERGKDSAIESLEEIKEILADNTKMVFVTAGMGGGTGTGAAPVIAEAAREMGILTVGIVTIPFVFEGPVRINQAMDGIAEMKKHVDSLLIINNERLRELYGNLSLSDAFSKADNVLAIAAKGIAEIITVSGYINVDFADVETVMRESGVAVMGSGVGTGPERAIQAIQEALNSPLLNSNDIRGSKHVLLNVSSGTNEVTMDELKTITDYLEGEVGPDATVIWGAVKDGNLNEEVVVTLVATGFESTVLKEKSAPAVSVETKPRMARIEMDAEGEIRSEPIELPVRESVVRKEPTAEELRRKEIDHFYRPVNPAVQPASSRSAAEPEGIPNRGGVHAVGGAVNFQNFDGDDYLDQLERIPAFQRRMQERNQANENSLSPDATRVSRFSINSNTRAGEPTIRGNSYLHDNVD